MSEFLMRTAEVGAVKINGEKLPLVSAVSEETKRTVSTVEAFGEKAPVATVGEKTEYLIKIAFNSNKVSLHNEDNFELELEDDDKTVVYRGCKCTDIQRISKTGMPTEMCVSIIAASREEQ